MTDSQLFIYSIMKMDTKSLETVLFKNTFKKHSNNSFLEKLDKLFDELKSNGNTSLEIYKGVGICSCNKGKEIFCFAGNKTKDYFTLSYQEDGNIYYNFSKSCSEVKYDKKLELNKFYYFSINPKETLEYKEHQESYKPIKEYKELCSTKRCSIKSIHNWLEDYKATYSNAIAILNDKKRVKKLNAVELLVTQEFEILYGKMSVICQIHKKEAYFKKQLDSYSTIKNNVSELKKWFDYQDYHKDEYQLFSSVFYDSRSITHFNLVLDELTLDKEDFKSTLTYMSIIEDSKAIEIEGIVEFIEDLIAYKKPNSDYPYTKREVIISIDDFSCSKYKVVFNDERTKHLNNIKISQPVKVLARLVGFENETTSVLKEYNYSLYGWNIEKVKPKKKKENDRSEMDLYHKYIMPLPF